MGNKSMAKQLTKTFQIQLSECDFYYWIKFAHEVIFNLKNGYMLGYPALSTFFYGVPSTNIEGRKINNGVFSFFKSWRKKWKRTHASYNLVGE